MRTPDDHPGWRWVVLAVGTAGQTATSTFIYGLPVLIPALRAEEGLSLLAASVVVAAPMAGLLSTLIVWGALADRFGERVVMASGTGLSAVALVVAAAVHGTVPLAAALAVAGAAGASVNAASGRAVIGWFPVRGRGVAMGIRQTATPLGGALAALAFPPIAQAHRVSAALLFAAACCALACLAVVALLSDPPRRPAAAGESMQSPYRAPTLARVHAASAFLVVPQFAVSTFTVVYLVGERGWDPVAAGRFMFLLNLAGAAGRIGAGSWSDSVRSRLGPMRQLAVISAALMGLLALGASLQAGWTVALFALAGVVTVADNGLAYTAVAELAGAAWAGRALGVQNTAQNVAAVATAPLLAIVIGDGRYALGFLVVAAFPLIAAPLTPTAADPVRLAESTPGPRR